MAPQNSIDVESISWHDTCQFLINLWPMLTSNTRRSRTTPSPPHARWFGNFEALPRFVSLILLAMRLDLETCCVSSSSCSSPYSSAGVSADRLVMSELEAAEALADFAHLATQETGGESDGQWGSKGKRARKRVASESPAGDSGLNHIDSVRSIFDLGQDEVYLEQRESQTICKHSIGNPVKSEQYEESLKLSLMCSRSYESYGGSRGRQQLTEEEKEARRLRRVLANRESARQTIRRRQALCEELTRKAADLSWENKNLNNEKELALKEYQYLETTNKKLKAKLAKLVKVKLDETKGEPKTADIQMPKRPMTEPPFLLYSQRPFQPLCGPSIIQSSNLYSSPGLAPSIIPLPAIENLASSQPENSMNLNGSRNPVYILPCPWFFPMPDRGNGVHPKPSSVFKSVHDKTALDNCCSASSSSETILYAQDCLASFPLKVKSEPSHSTEARFIADLNQIPPELPAEGGDQRAGPQANEMILTPRVLSTPGQTFTVKHENATQSQSVPGTKSIPTKVTDTLSSLTEQSRDLVNYSTKKFADTVAAAEARKRRKELTKLKNLHGHQCRMKF